MIVMATLGLLALLVASLASAGRSRISLANNDRASAAAEAAADGAVQRAIFALRGGTWLADGSTRRVKIGAAIVGVEIDDEGGRINPNISPPALLASLLEEIGVNPAQARALSRRIVDWRTATPFSLDGGMKLDAYRQAGLPYGPPDRAFDSVDEIGLVLGVTPNVLNGLRPYISVYQSGDPSLGTSLPPGGVQAAVPAAVPAAVQAAVQDAQTINNGSVLAGFSSQDKTVRIHAAAALPDGTEFVRTAIVRLRPNSAPGSTQGSTQGQAAWLILSWD
jgi:general secretion pathway protein K